MSGIKNASRRSRPDLSGQTGTAAVEFALVAIIFLTIVFGVMELARAVYVVNTLFEVTRRAAQTAAKTSFDNEAKLLIQQKAIFRTSSGPLLFGDPVRDDHIHIDYMSLQAGAGGALTPQPILSGNMPASPANNRLICLANPNAAQCIRLVRVRVCATADANSCTPVRYESMFPLIDLPFDLPTATTIVMAETLGFTEGMLPLP
jgi:hypothetical protein